MSGYYNGPFGRTLPAADTPLPEPLAELLANCTESGDSPYQLPPPRVPPNLPFGTDQRSGQHQQGENAELGRGSVSTGSSAPHQRNEQLPSVRQLLTPATQSSSPPSLSQPFAPTASSIEHRDISYPSRHHEPGLATHLPAATLQGRTKNRSESLPQAQTGSLPPLSQVAPREIKHHAATRSDPSTSLFQHSQYPPHDSPYHEKALSGDVSSPESASRSTRSTVSTVLPHVVDERYIEGEGLCYIYADGSHCPKIIEGVPVNANWGITKAGKPRKRLAQACLTCREKKIKCQPNLPKCDQCQKSGRECRFESAPRGNRPSGRGSHSAGTPGKYNAKEGCLPGDHGASDVSMYDLAGASGSTTSLPGTSGHSPMSEGPRVTPTEGSSETMVDADRALRARMYRMPHPFVSGADPLARQPDHIETNRLPEYADILGELQSINPDDPLAASWLVDPYEGDPETAIHYVECFFSNVNDSLYHIFPHARFILWVKSCRTKSAEDKLLLYSMMALGALFSDRPDRVGTLRRFSRIARFAIQKSQHTLSLQLAQSHLILSLWYYATGSLVRSWDSIGAAGRVVSGLRYNMESGVVIVDQNQACVYGLHPQASMECRRRTFWVSFILDRLSTCFSASSSFTSSGSALIRLPCREETYEAQQYATAPYFQSIFNQPPISTEDDRSALSPMAFLIQILSIWGDVSLHVLRVAHTPLDSYVRLAEEFHTDIIRRTDDWSQKLPEHLTFSVVNMERAVQAKKTDVFISVHMLYHATLMKLYRHARYQSMRSEVLVQYIHRARYHAVEILRIAIAVMQHTSDQSSRSSAEVPSPKVTLLSPFLGYFILSAVDVLSAASLMTELSDCISFIRGSLGMVQLLGHQWDSSLELVNVIQKRLDVMAECLSDRPRMQDKLGFSVDGPSLEAKVHVGSFSSHCPSALDDDLFYGSMPREMLLHAMRVDNGAFPENSIVWLKDR